LDRRPGKPFCSPFGKKGLFLRQLNRFQMKFTFFFLILGLGVPEVIGILLVILLLFGGRKIPELARGLGRGIREFNNAKNAVESEIKEGIKEGDREKTVSKN
jgi:sec-independent protein translocase protein TatA